MKKLNFFLLALISILLAQGCSTPYFGHTKKEWDKFTKEEKTAIKKEYQYVLEFKNSQAHKDKINARTQTIIDLGANRQF